MNETILSISLLNERFGATAVHRGNVVNNWERPAPVADFADFSSVLRDAIKQTGYAGTPAIVVLAHQRLAEQQLECSPGQGHCRPQPHDPLRETAVRRLRRQRLAFRRGGPSPTQPHADDTPAAGQTQPGSADSVLLEPRGVEAPGGGQQ